MQKFLNEIHMVFYDVAQMCCIACKILSIWLTFSLFKSLFDGVCQTIFCFLRNAAAKNMPWASKKHASSTCNDKKKLRASVQSGVSESAADLVHESALPLLFLAKCAAPVDLRQKISAKILSYSC